MDHYAESTWYAYIVNFILYLQCPEHLDKKAARSLKLKTTKYCLIEQQLFWKYPGGILLRCLDKPKIEGVSLNPMKVHVEDISIGRQQHIKFSEHDIIGPLYFQMYINR